MMKILEAVPNFSEGRDLERVERIVSTIASHDVEVLDWSADLDHHRSVVTFIGLPDDVRVAAVAAARVARDEIDLRQHRGVHPRVGALDVLPFVPLEDATMDDVKAFFSKFYLPNNAILSVVGDVDFDHVAAEM